MMIGVDRISTPRFGRIWGEGGGVTREWVFTFVVILRFWFLVDVNLLRLVMWYPTLSLLVSVRFMLHARHDMRPGYVIGRG